MHIYVEIMYALIHMCRVLHNKASSKTPIILLKGIKVFNDKIARKIPPSNPNWLEFEHYKVFEVHKARKGPEITSLT